MFAIFMHVNKFWIRVLNKYKVQPTDQATYRSSSLQIKQPTDQGIGGTPRLELDTWWDFIHGVMNQRNDLPMFILGGYLLALD